MPGITGSQKAYKLALANVARAQTTRAAYFLRDTLPVLFNAVARSGTIRESINISLNTGEEPHRASFDFKGGSGFVPAPGQTVSICHGSSANKLFAGRLIKVTRTVARNIERRPTYHCEASGFIFDMDQSRVFPGFSVRSLAPRSIVRHLLVSTSPNLSSLGFTANAVDPTLGYVEEFSTGPTERPSEAIARMFRGVDAAWYMDHAGDVHAFPTVNSLPSVPTTITAAASHVWNVSYQPTDFSKVFTRVHVRGAVQTTLADANTSLHQTIAMQSSSLVATANTAPDDDIFVGTSESWMLGNIMHVGSLIYRPESAFEPFIRPTVFVPATIGSNTLTLAMSNISSVQGVATGRWYDVAGQYLYLQSPAGVFSATASSIAWSYYVPTSGPGAITSDIQTGADVAGLWCLQAKDVSSLTPAAPRYIPAGTPLQVHVTRTNSAGVNYIGSLTNNLPYALISRELEDQRLTAEGAVAVASAALERGDPSNWVTVDFTTREREYEIGGPVFLSMTSPAESGGPSIAGVYTVHDMNIGGFGRLTDTKGPERTITAGAVRRPTFWQVLQGV